jgi:hypothetical protein
MKRCLLTWVPLVAALAVGPPVVGAAPVAPVVVPVSGVAASPFAGCTADLVELQRALGSVDYPNSEVEPYVAVNPTNANNLIAVWQQDRWDSSGSRGNLAGVSFDGGNSWQIVEVTRSSACSGNPFWARATDPWVTFSPDGTAYFMHLGIFSPLVTLPDTLYVDGMAVVRSTDGGLSWGEPTTLVLDTSPTVFHDKNSITADPNNGDFVYAVWDALIGPPSGNENPNAAAYAEALTSRTLFARTTNGGETWERVRTILEPGTRNQTIGNQIVVRPESVGGELVDLFTLIHERKNAKDSRGGSVAVQISGDHGSTWSDPIVAAKMLPRPVVDPNTGAPVRTGDDNPDAAVDPTNGDLYAVWSDARFSAGAYNDIALGLSTDGGRHWSGPVAVPRALTGVSDLNRQAFTPQVHVSGDGRLAVVHYDFRNNDGAGGDSDTDYFVSQCAEPDPAEPDLCAGEWAETRVTATSFDLREAPVSVGRGFFLGDYVGLTDVPGAFGTAFTVSSSADPATTYFSTVPFAP